MAGSVPLSVQVGRKLRSHLRRCSLQDEKISTLGAAPNLTIMTVEQHEADWAVSVSGGDHAACPLCGVRSHSRHGSYRRTLRDLPAQGASVEVRARLTRWRCRNEQCERRIFAERIPGLAAPFARRITRLAGIAICTESEADPAKMAPDRDQLSDRYESSDHRRRGGDAGRWSAEVAATKTMLTRTQESFGLPPETLAADAAYGSGLMLGWLMRRGIEPHIPILDR